MKDAVRAAFVPMSTLWEGRCSYMYADIKGLITTGIGNLIDPVEYALQLPWRKPNGELASYVEILAEWHRLKQDRNAPKAGHRYAARITSLRLPDDEIDKLVVSKMASNHAVLRLRFAQIDDWPADAILAAHSMAWALGPRFAWPKFSAALRRRDFGTAAKECTISEAGNPGVAPRNRGNRIMLTNAAIVDDRKLDPTVVYWPKALSAEPTQGQ